MALWCGDNELVGALTWYPESQQNRDRYLAIYDRLNHALEEAIDTLQPDIAFWPSSPSAGRLDYADAWHHDRSGDMHFWDVWHSSKDFEHYRTVRPRFCSEFGFQSFPSMSVIESFTAPDDRNVSSKVMDVHQRNPGGNSRIVETISRYFRFPERFEDMVYVSQISQALAMQTAIEFWRANAPRTMGTLYWQLNDTWPVASWASLEYGGNWKLTHYLARRFFAPILVTAQPNEETGDIEIFAIADQAQTEQIKVRAELVSTKGDITLVGDYEALLEANKPNVVHKISAGDVPDDCFLHLSWFSHDGQLLGENDYLPHRPKHYAFQTPNIDVAVSHNGHEVTLSTDQPALYVTYDHGSKNIYSDNCFTLLPGRPKTIKLTRERGDALDQTHVVQWLNF
jgi:beta-mannosidase